MIYNKQYSITIHTLNKDSNRYVKNELKFNWELTILKILSMANYKDPIIPLIISTLKEIWEYHINKQHATRFTKINLKKKLHKQADEKVNK